MRLVISNATENVKLTEPGLSDGLAKQTFGDYWITFHLLPYPEAGKERSAGEYRLLLSVGRLKSK